MSLSYSAARLEELTEIAALEMLVDLKKEIVHLRSENKRLTKEAGDLSHLVTKMMDYKSLTCKTMFKQLVLNNATTAQCMCCLDDKPVDECVVPHGEWSAENGKSIHTEVVCVDCYARLTECPLCRKHRHYLPINLGDGYLFFRFLHQSYSYE